MKLELRNKYLSRPRYNRYLVATANSHVRAKKLYNANIRLAQAFHPILSQFEVVLRNSLNIILSAHFADADWIINQKTGFMRDPSLRRSHFFLKSCVLKAEGKLTRRSIPITGGKIISDQTFGFWIAFFLPHHYSLVGGQPIHAFAHKPSTENRASIYDKLDDIKKFRNRVNHCEPLCFAGGSIDCATAIEIRNKLYELLEWIDPDMVPFFESIDNIRNKIDNIMRI
ncbi:MAG: Abi family protein [Bacteroidia bacterium]